MDEKQETEEIYRRRDQFEDEIELIDILRVLWKWKYLILAGTLVFALIAGIVSLNRPKIYRISMILEPGVIGMGGEGQKIYIDTAANIKTAIEAGTFNNEIRDHLNNLKIKNRPGSLEFRVVNPKRSTILKIAYETQFIDVGKEILSYLPQVLLKKYVEDIEFANRRYEVEIASKLIELEQTKNIIKLKKISIINLKKRFKEITLDINLLENNNEFLIREKNNSVKLREEDPSNKYLLYNNAIQQNVQLINQYKDQCMQCLVDKKQEEFQIREKKEEAGLILGQIDNLKKHKNNTEYIKVLQSPTVSRRPIKPRPKVALIVSCVTGLFIMIFVASFLEYVSKHRRRKRHE